jgi:hypothetical protein
MFVWSGVYLTIQELVYQDKVVLDALLIQLPEIALRDIDETVQELEY